jgi:hypothetical protein
MAFEIEDFAAAKLLDHQTLSDKDREPDANPGQSLAFEMTIGNEMLSMFDGALRSMLYQKSAGSPGANQQISNSDLPNLTNIASHVKRLAWNETFQSLILTIQQGTGRPESNLQLIDCKALGFVFLPKEGGSLLMKFKVEAPNVPEFIAGKLPKLKSTEVKLMLVQPDVVADPQQRLDEPTPTKGKAEKGAAPLTPEQALAASAKQEPAHA